MSKKIIKSGTVVTASDTYVADVEITDGIITKIGKNLESEDAEIVDATGLYVFPGGVDPHTHLDLFFGGTTTADDFETGTKAAAFGGTTTIIDFCMTSKGEPLQNGIEAWKAKSSNKAVIDYGFHLAIAEVNEQVLQELPIIMDQEGITSFKIFMAYKNAFQVDDETLFRTLLMAKEQGGLVMVHAENGDVIEYLVEEALKNGHTSPIHHANTRPPEVEAEATGRAAQLTGMANSQLYVVHVSCAASLAKIAEARDQGIQVWGETCPQYLTLDKSLMDQPGFEGGKYVWSPPLREKWNQEPLWRALKNGQLQTIGSDHCSFNFNGQKDLGKDNFTKIPNGGPGVEDRFSILYSEGVAKGRLSLNQFVDVVSTRSAKLFGLFPRKGTIAIGSDGDVVLFDPQVKRTLSASTHHMNVDYSSYEGMEITGEPISVLLRGEFVIRERSFVGQIGQGQYLKRNRYLVEGRNDG